MEHDKDALDSPRSIRYPVSYHGYERDNSQYPMDSISSPHRSPKTNHPERKSFHFQSHQPEMRKSVKFDRNTAIPDTREDTPKKKSSWFLKTPFLSVMTFVQIVMLIVSCIRNSQWTGSFVAPVERNFMIGPSAATLIWLGARFTPCIRSTSITNITCPDDAPYSPGPNTNNKVCSIATVCGIESFTTPNQWYRLLIPTWLHAGFIHLLVNLSFQCTTGFQLERDFGSFRIGFLYLLTGFGGWLMGALIAPLTIPSIGASGALFGLVALILNDLIFNWKTIEKPTSVLIRLIIVIVLSFVLGLLPILDNFAHIGGFLFGFLASPMILPLSYRSKKEKHIRMIIQYIISPVLTIIMFAVIASSFYGPNPPPRNSWTQYLGCLPVFGWCNAFDTPN